MRRILKRPNMVAGKMVLPRTRTSRVPACFFFKFRRAFGGAFLSCGVGAPVGGGGQQGGAKEEGF